ncbi:hypothetical protein [Calothrix sp. CCY 0018]|uniref:hypothetical protein n=1 Tax=Calothrix sp. CCY 0018 TaxID=3103864 RepID=UPI0039C67FA7
MNELPLQELFTRLREAGLPLGIDEYRLVLRSLQGGFGITDKAALKRLCQTLWVKSTEEKSIFDYHFEQAIGSDAVAPVSETVNKSWLRQIYPIASVVILGMLGVGIIFGIRVRQKPPTIQPTPTPTLTATPEPKLPQTPTQPENPTPTATPIATAKPILTTKQINLIIWIILFLTAITFEYLLYRWVCNWLSKRKQKRTPNPPASTPPQTNDEAQVVKSVLLASSGHLKGDFFPVTQRQMKQIWRYLRRRVREGKPTELDVEATINHIGHNGILLEPILIPSRVNRAELLLLIDQDGSMMPFHALSQRLAETALGGGRLGRTGIYYFHNCPVEYLYRDSYHQRGELFRDILTYVCSERTTVLVFSDAGAARGGYSEERYQLTQEFLTQLQQQVRHIAWLNPMPKKRWLGTTANEISSLIPMFEFSQAGLQDAISVLCGRPTNFEGRKK